MTGVQTCALPISLQCFGGAGGQHACLVADALGMTRVFVHPMAGVLSAYGMGLADQNVIKEQAIELKLTTSALPEIAQALNSLAATAEAELQRQQVNTGSITTHHRVHVRYEGSDAALAIPIAAPTLVASRTALPPEGASQYKRCSGFVIRHDRVAFTQQ